MNTVDSLLTGRFKQILDNVRHLRWWQMQLDDLVPHQMRGQIHVVQCDGRKLSLITPSASWATRFRFSKPQILTALQGLPQGKALTEIDCRVRPFTPVSISEPRKTVRHISAAACDLIATTASTIKDPGLAAALTKLSGK